MLDKEQLRAIFLYEFKRGRKAAETSRNINEAFDQDTVNERAVQRWFARFRNGDGSLEDEEHGNRSSEVDDEQLKTLIEADPLKTTREVAEELNVDQSTVVRHLKKIGKVKKLDKWIPYELNESKKKIVVSISHWHSFCATTMILFSIEL
ncbi:Histone-lysine N-methyltransferase SETMAR [Anthophora plagiata]